MSAKLLKIRKRSDVTPELLAKVKNCGASGCSFTQTSLICGYEEDSLRRWCVSDYNEGRAHIVGRAGATLCNMALGDEKKGTRPNLSALIFFLKCQGGWRETTGIVFEEAKPTEENASRLIDILEARFKKLGEAKQRKTNGDAPTQSG